MSRIVTLPTRFYQQFDADTSLAVPAEGYGGWQIESLPLDLDHTALIVMHAWSIGAEQDFPGWYRAVESISRVGVTSGGMGPVLSAARAAQVPVIHVVGGPTDYWTGEPGHAPNESRPEPQIARAEQGVAAELIRFHEDRVFPGKHNSADMDAGFEKVTFAPSLRPVEGERIAATSQELDDICRERSIEHLIYTGFTINGCIMFSPAGMVDMGRRGYLCSTIDEAVTAIENRETAAAEAAKALELWRVALLFGYVYSAGDLIAALDEPRAVLDS